MDPDQVIQTPGSGRGTLSERSRRRAQRELDRQAPSFAEAFQQGRELDAVGPAISDMISRETPETDPGFEFTDEVWGELTEDVPVSQQDIFMDAGSREEADNIRKRFFHEKELAENIASAGWTGMSARFLAATLDETALAAAVASEGMATPWILAAKGGRLARIGKAAFVSGTTESALETVVQSQRETKGLKDVMWAGLIGGALGAPYGAFASPRTPGFAGDAERFRRAADAVSEEQYVDTLQDVTGLARVDAEEVLATQRQRGDELRQARAERDQAAARESRAEASSPFDVVAREDGLDGGDLAATTRGDPVARAQRDEAIDQQLWGKLRGSRKGELDKRASKRLGRKRDDRLRRAQQVLDGEVQTARANRAQMDTRVAELESLIETGRIETDRLVREAPAQTRTGGAPRRTPELPDALRKARSQRPVRGASEAGGRSAGAASTEGTMPDSTLDSPINEDLVPDDAARRQSVPFKNVRFDMAGRLMQSKSGTMELLARRMLSDPIAGDSGKRVVGQGDQVVTPAAGAEEGDRIFTAAGYHFLSTALPAWKRHARARGLNPLQTAFNHQEREKLFTDATKAVRTGVDPADPNVKQAADALRDGFQAMAERAKEADVAGFQDLAENLRYVHRQWHPGKIRELVDDPQVKGEGVRQLITESILRGDPEIPPDIADKMAKAVFRRFNDKGHGIQADFNRGFFGRDVPTIRRVLKEAELEDSDIEDVIRHLQENDSANPSTADAGNTKFAKRRITMDEDTTVTLSNGRRLHFSDLTENNAEKLFMNYSRSMAGHVALARQFRPIIRETRGDDFLAENGVNVEAEFTRLKNIAASEGATEKELSDLTMAYNMMLGRPPEDRVNSAFHHVLRFARDWNFVRLMGQVGFAQVAEFGPILGQVGMGTAMKNIPKFRQLVKRGKDGSFDEPMLRELAEFDLVFGAERMIMQPNFRMEEWGMEGSSGVKWLNEADNALQVVKRGVSDVSGMSGITIYLQRLAGLSAGQRLMKMAKKGQLDNARMRSLGIDSDMAQRIQKELVEKSGKKQTEDGRMADVMNLKDWEDTEAREVLVNSMHRWGSRMVQRNLIGELPAFMHTTVGQVLGQFRSFMLNAYQKQLLQGLNMRDFQTFATFSFSMLFAGMSYTAQQTLNSLGQDDPQGFRDQRLSPWNIGLSAFQRAGFASLVPGVIDTTLPLVPTLDEGIFAYGRSTGLATNFLMGNPTVDLATSGFGALKGALAAPTEGSDFSQGNFRDLWGIMAGNNVTGIRNVGNFIGRELPRQSNRNPRTLEDYLGIEDAR